jgi:hypothetical protein
LSSFSCLFVTSLNSFTFLWQPLSFH